MLAALAAPPCYTPLLHRPPSLHRTTLAVLQVQTSGLCAQGITLASLHGDGALQVAWRPLPATAFPHHSEDRARYSPNPEPHSNPDLQVVVPTTAGLVHVLDGKTGRERQPFPVRTEGQILAAALVLPLRTRRGALEPHLVVSSFDGFVYVVNGQSGCSHRIDVGEHAYTQVLADDLTGNGARPILSLLACPHAHRART